MVKFSRKVASLFVSFISLAFGNYLCALAMVPAASLVAVEDDDFIIKVSSPDAHIPLTPDVYEKFLRNSALLYSLYRDPFGSLYFVDCDSKILEPFCCFDKQLKICDDDGKTNKAWSDIEVHECFC